MDDLKRQNQNPKGHTEVQQGSGNQDCPRIRQKKVIPPNP